jgi:hypothetical protein
MVGSAWKERVFVLGDSRTGTSSFHALFLRAGLKSIHYYEEEAEMLPHEAGNRSENTRRLLRYIGDSGIQCFSDYPTRLYYKELHAAFPESLFILTKRVNVKVWCESMLNYFDHITDIDELAFHYLRINADISRFFGASGNFYEVAIDAPGFAGVFCRIRRHLLIDGDAQFPHVNRWQDKE